jgi:PhnB protein
MPDVKPIPDSYPRVSPHLSIVGAAEAIDYYKSVFGATERMRMPMPDGKIAHAEIELDGSVIMIGEEMPGGVDPSPKTLGGSPVALFVYVEDVPPDEMERRAAEVMGGA